MGEIYFLMGHLLLKNNHRESFYNVADHNLIWDFFF